MDTRHVAVLRISIHALHEESDLFVFLVHFSSFQFQSTLSMRRATGLPRPDGMYTIISIHALHEESDQGYFQQRCYNMISIHALHEESDQTLGVASDAEACISIHALHEESDPQRCLGCRRA